MIRPPILVAGDLVAIVATARSVDRPSMEAAATTIRSWGFEVAFGNHLFDTCDQFAGKDQLRLEDLQWAFDNPKIKAILCARGGYGTSRILDQINFEKLLQTPKWVCGFSDVTALLCHLHKLNLESIHSTMPLLFKRPEHEGSCQSLKNLLLGESPVLKTKAHVHNQEGQAMGQVVGGNLSILIHLLGTSSELDTDDKILFLEDIDEYLYHIDRMILQLLRAGKLDKLTGLIVGHMTDMNDNEISFGKSAYEIIRSHVRMFNYPVGFAFPLGHDQPNIALPVGRVGQLSVKSDGAELSFKI